MAFYQLGQLFSVQAANEIKKLWASDTPPPGLETGEVWLNIGQSPPRLERWTGSTSEVIGSDADTLDGQHGGYYRDAGNLNAGDLSRARLSALWFNNNTGSGATPFIQAGTITLATGDVWESIAFDYAFTAAPLFVMSLEDSTLTINSSKYQNLTTTGVQVSADRPAVVSWIAIGAKT